MDGSRNLLVELCVTLRGIEAVYYLQDFDFNVFESCLAE
jgi:hypothetical protein